MENRTFKYDFFISYKHGEWDSKISGYLQKQLESYKIPKEVQKRCGKEKITRVFRDKEELSVTADLTQEIEDQLKNTEYLIVMCSPRSKQSVWVNREIETFLKYRGWEHILPVLIEGEPKEAFPDILFQREMLAADVRGKTFGEVKKKCKDEMLRLLAPALKCSYDELRQRNRLYASRRIAVTAIGLAAIAAGFGAYAWNQSVQIQENYWQKLENQAGMLAEKSIQLLEDGDREAALLVALEALPSQEGSQDKPLVGKAQIALEEALYLYQKPSVTALRPTYTLKMDNGTKKVYALHDNKTMLVSCDDKSYIYVWDLETGELHCRYTYLHDIDEDCKAILAGSEHQVFFCTESRILLFDYETGEVLWEVTKDQFSEGTLETWHTFTLSPDRDQLALMGYGTICILDASTGERTHFFPIEQENWSGRSMVWNPNGTELALADYGSYTAGAILLVDLPTETQRIIKTLESNTNLTMAYKSEDRLTYAWTNINNYSIGQYFDYADYFVGEIDTQSGGILWEVKEQTILRDSQQQIRHVCAEDAGQLYDLTIVTMGSEVIAIRDGELWCKFTYDSAIVGYVSYGLVEQHITADGKNYLVCWSGKFIQNDYYKTFPLVDNISLAESIRSKGIVVFPDFGGGVLHVYDLTEDPDYVELENSGEAFYIDYSPNKKYRIAKESLASNYYNRVLNVWDLERGEHIFRQEFLYDSESRTGDFLLHFGFLDDQYFYYCTYFQLVLMDVETLEVVATYDYSSPDSIIFNHIDDLFVVQGEDPGAYFTDYAGTLYHYSFQKDQSRILMDIQSIRAFLAEQFTEESSLYFTANPAGTHLILTGRSYKDDFPENKYLVWDVATGEIDNTFSMTFQYNTFDVQFSSNGMEMLFQNKADGLQVMDLASGTVSQVPIAGDSFQAFWFSPDDRYIFAYTHDYFLRVYDREAQKQTLNLECDAATLKNWYFDGDTLYISVSYNMTQPKMFVYQQMGEGVYECVSIVANCEMIIGGKAYVRTGSYSDLCYYPHRSLDEMIQMAKEILNGRELTEIERQRYSLD